MPASRKKPSDAKLNTEIHAFAMKALAIAKAVVDGSSTPSDKSEAKELAEKIPVYAERAKEMAEAYRADALRALADARLDLAFAAAGGGIPSSIRLGRYIAEKEARAKTEN